MGTERSLQTFQDAHIAPDVLVLSVGYPEVADLLSEGTVLCIDSTECRRQFCLGHVRSMNLAEEACLVVGKPFGS